MNDLGGVSKATLRERRRFAWRRLRGRMLAWRYLLIAAGLVLVIGLGSWIVYFSGWMDVSKVDVVGANTQITPAMIEKAARLPVGTPLASADLGAIENRLMTDPSLQGAVATADVSREWPDTIKIVLTLRTPVAAVNFGDHCQALDANGSLFLSYPAAGSGCAKPLDVLPVVQSPPAGANSGQAYLAAAGVAGQMPVSLRKKVAYIGMASEDGITLHLTAAAGGATVIWGNKDNVTLKAQVLAALMKDHPDAVEYKVAVPGGPGFCPPNPAPGCVE